MSFAADLASVVTGQLTRFITLNRHQLAGQAANLDFWLAQAGHCLAVIDGYGGRFERLRAAQQRYVADHGTVETRLDPDGASRAHAVPPPRRVPSEQLAEARRALADAAYRFLVRLCHEGFVPPARVREACAVLGIGVEASDLRPRRA